MMDNIVQHYQNRHEQCQPESRCRRDPHYEPSKMLLKSAKAVELLTAALHHTVVYQHPEDFVMAMDTYYVESFNTTLNMFQDKRISFGNEEYLRRSQLAVLHWNENINRGHTSVWEPAPIRCVTRKCRKKKKTLTKQSFAYADSIWNRFMGQLFEEAQFASMELD